MDMYGLFSEELFKGNVRNNYLYEARKGCGLISGVPVFLEPFFESLDATKPFSRTEESSVSVVCNDKFSWSFVKLRLPLLDKLDWSLCESLINTLSGLGCLCSFEAVYKNGLVEFYFGSVNKRMLNSLVNVLRSFYSSIVVIPVSDPLINQVLSDYFVLQSDESYSEKLFFDRSVSIFSLIQKSFSASSGLCVLQCLYFPVVNDWLSNIKELQRAEKYLNKKSVLVKDVSRSLFASSIRVASTNKDTLNGFRSLFGGFSVSGKSLNLVSSSEYKKVVGKKAEGLVSERLVYSSGMILNCEELVGFIHVPDKFSVCSDFVKGLPVPNELKSGRALGTNDYSGKNEIVHFFDRRENLGTWVLGASRFGKSVFIINALLAFVKDFGVGFFDPHRVSAKKIIGSLPEDLIERVVYLDFEDTEYTVAYNPFDEINPDNYGRLTLEAVNSLKHLFEAETFHRMNHILRMCVFSLFVLKKNLSSIPVLLSKSGEGNLLRKQVIASTLNDEVKRFWRSDFSSFKPEAFSPLINRLSALFLDQRIARVFSTSKSLVRIDEIMSEGKIFVCALPAIVDLSDTLGGLFMSQFQKCALARTIRDGKHKRFFLFLDEFSRFSSEKCIDSLVNETVKTGMNLCVANQSIAQLSPKMLSIVLSMPNLLVFNVGSDDAKKMSAEFNKKVSAEELSSLEVGECAVRFGNHITTMKGFPPTKTDSRVAEKIIAYSRKNYYTKIVEEKVKPLTVRELDHF